MDIEIIYRRNPQTIELIYPEATRRLWQAATERARLYLRRPDVAQATEEVAVGLLTEWEVGQAALHHLAYTFVPPVQLTAMEAHLAFNLVAASNLYLIRHGKRWKHTQDALLTLARIVPVAVDPVTLPPAESLRCLDMTLWEDYEKLRAALSAESAWISMYDACKWYLELVDYSGPDHAVTDLTARLNQVSAPLQFAMDSLGDLD